jgi:hypothetical protein
MPMRILSQGRDAYILAGYLEKRGKWTWSERYFVLTPTHLHYFKKHREELWGDARGQLQVSRMKVQQKEQQKKKHIFEIIVDSDGVLTPSAHAQQQRQQHGGGAAAATAGHAHGAHVQQQSYVLKAKNAEECNAWLNAIRDAQMALAARPDLVAAADAYGGLPAVPRTLSSRSRMLSTAVNVPKIPPISPLVDPAKVFAHDRKTSRTRLNSLPIAMPVVPNATLPPLATQGATDALSPLSAARAGESQSSQPAALSLPPAAVTPSIFDDGPILLVTVEQAHKKKYFGWTARSHLSNKAELVAPEIVIGRQVPFGSPLTVRTQNAPPTTPLASPVCLLCEPAADYMYLFVCC